MRSGALQSILRIAAVIIPAAAACTLVTDSCACDRVPLDLRRLVVLGRVVEATGAGAPGTVVTVDASTGPCSTFASVRYVPTWAITTSDGAYFAEISVRGPVPDACVRVSRVRSTTDLAPLTTVERHPVRITASSPFADTIRVDMVLP